MKGGECMTITKNGKGYRIRQQKDGIRYSIQIDHKPTKREAEELIQEHIRNASGMPSECHGASFETAANEYINLKCNILSPNTIRGYQKITRNLPEWFTKKSIDHITALDVQKVINDRAAIVSAKTVRNDHGFISAVLSVYRENLRLKTKMPLKGKFEPYTPIDSDVQQIIDSVMGTKYEIPFRLAVYGMRRGEICAVTAADLDGHWLSINKSLAEDPDGGWVVKPIPKTSESIRQIYIDDELCDLIRQKDGALYDGKPSMLDKTLHKKQDELGLPSFRLHDFRAYYVSFAHKIGIPDKYIRQNCGFASSAVMDRHYKRIQSDAMAAYNQEFAEKWSKNGLKILEHPIK
jgi:integrase